MGGLTLFWGSSIFLVYVYYRGGSKPQQSRYYFDTTKTTLTGNRENAINENFIG